MCLDISSVIFKKKNPLLFRWKISVEPTNKRKIHGIACKLKFFGYFVKRNTPFGSEAFESIIHALPQCQKL
jgi:hypothetical protein